MAKKRITRVYTKTGDDGYTSLVFGQRVSKASKRVTAYGDVDELNSFIGVIRSKNTDKRIDNLLTAIQNDLFIIGADLASVDSDKSLRLTKKRVAFLERNIDKYLENLEPLKEFILPGGSEAGSFIHLARTVARRAERNVALLKETEEINGLVLIYLNRLSDLFFVLARIVNKNAEQPETLVDFKKN
ncbi:MAG: cob(I)yrinic acid a,c-diamide adenosyltransferase [Candidatus Dadabacteria bacterium]|nr:cob(I)yrinic acid a,c-diamide adenosyltransferase [Candidatus Dadabacteria bacterium]NIS08063.1 cob(I)yrinic acid a,c-diamide adenosyltransferase [Candidatus Dadabacteria bacterium]NIV42311.1 cob(I)yrinic acid a,c-diamide adenosyltransferase [Candidatus Dadabacteria bacterium]NIX14806.1 cob(I)yrinic acid a,c-diamide adenosyltransferase [Candidatus Dadabacteria bacterium]NIY21347.1 cob(I)yrinic acid a,c-diamide adenosyltransferase [Candidatus Dadabacteria bacterium]